MRSAGSGRGRQRLVVASGCQERRPRRTPGPPGRTRPRDVARPGRRSGRRPVPGPGTGTLGLPVAPLKSSALRDWETRVTGKGDVPFGARAAEVGGAPPCLVELPMPAGSAEPWFRTQFQPRSIRRPFRHEKQNMPLCWPRPSLTYCRPLSQLRPAPAAVAPHRLRKLRGCSDARLACSWCRACPPRPGMLGARCRGETRHLGPLLSGCTVRPRRTR